MSNYYPKNFDPAEYLGFDGSMFDEADSDSKWAMWCNGSDPKFPKEFALFCWWHVFDALDTFVSWKDTGEWQNEYRGGGKLAETRFRKELNKRFKAVATIAGEAWKTQPFALESSFEFSAENESREKTSIQMMCAYSIKCFDDGISGLLESNPTKASMAFAFAIRSLEIAHEYRDGSDSAGKRSRQCQARAGAKAKLANDPKQTEKYFVRECWGAWQQKPDSYKGKAEFARDMLTKCEYLTSQKKIEDWCREWEKENVTQLAR
jgi:hypothetical protein